MSGFIERFWSKRILLFFFILFPFVSCIPVDATVPAPTAIALEPVSTLRQTNTAEPPTREATALSTNTIESTAPTATFLPTSSPTPENTQTPRPSSTPFPSATRLFSDSFSFPDWVSDPQASILIVSYHENNDDGTIYVVNAMTRQSFEVISLSDGYWVPEWFTPETRVKFSLYKASGSGNSSNRYWHQIDVLTGDVEQVPLSGGRLAPDQRFSANTIGERGEQSVVLVEQETGIEIPLADPFDGRFLNLVDGKWSVDSNLIGVLYYGFDEENPEQTTSALAVYTTEGTIYRTYLDTWFSDWAPDGSYRLLTIDGEYWENGEPCVLDIETNITDCLSEVAEWRENGIEKTGFYEWLPDGSGISFLYWDRSDRQTGVCMIELTSRIITCPINEMTIFSAAIGPEVGGFPYLIEHKWSPDGRYIALAIDPFGPGSDDRTLTQVATIARDGTQFHVWGFGGLWEAEWRPPVETTDD